MALQVSFNSKFGIIFPIAYAKVVHFAGDKEQISFDVGVYKDEQARVEDKEPLTNQFYAIPYIDGMAISSLYEYLKTLPEFTGAIDV